MFLLAILSMIVENARPMKKNGLNKTITETFCQSFYHRKL